MLFLFLENCPWKKIQKVPKRTLGGCKIQIVFKNQINLSNVFRFKDRLPYVLVSSVAYKFQCGTDRHLKVRSGEHIGISPLTFKKVKPSVKSSTRDHLLFCNHDPSSGDFTILAQGTNKFLLEVLIFCNIVVFKLINVHFFVDL